MKNQDQSVLPTAAPLQFSPDITSAAESAGNGICESLGIKGDLTASEDLIVRGRVDGSISLPDSTLTIDVRASVNARITARTVVVTGTINGPVTATDKLEIRGTGSVVGDVSSPRLILVDGGTLHGKVEMPGRDPAP